MNSFSIVIGNSIITKNNKMVKNTTGGSKAKGQARKFTAQPATNRLRLAHEDAELYAKVTAMLGNGMCEVVCIDGKKRLCHIRGKFKGRGKRDNFITRESFILIGLREWEGDEAKEVKGKIKLPNCDLLEVYNNSDVSRIKMTENKDWSIFATEEKSNSTENTDEIVDFTNNNIDEEYNSLMETTAEGTSNIIIVNSEQINIDDI